MSTAIEVEPPSVRFQTSEPGIYPDVSEEDYHRDCVIGGSLSSTGARTLIKRTPAHFDHERRKGRKDTDSFDLGRAAHTVLLGRGSDLAVCHYEDWKTKAAQREKAQARLEGKTPLLDEQWEAVQAMVAAVRAHSTAGRLFSRRDAQAELTCIARDPETGVMCRVRIDWLIPGVIVDFKTTPDASPAAMAKTMSDYDYMQQLDHYRHAYRLAAGLDEPPAVMLVAVEKNEPHLVGIGEPDEQSLAWGAVLNRKARGIYRDCSAAGHWPGYGADPVPLSLPGWRLNALEQAYDQGAFDITPTPTTTRDIPEQGGTP